MAKKKDKFFSQSYPTEIPKLISFLEFFEVVKTNFKKNQKLYNFFLSFLKII